MQLRKLLLKDAERMLEWMHDPFVVEKLQANFLEKTIDDCKKFIDNSHNAENIHLAIVDDDDLYMGTVSLKHITEKNAEFAITICRDAMGLGYSAWAMEEIIRIGFKKYGLSEIYWCVAEDNLRALKFYDKNKYIRVKSEDISISDVYSKEQIDSYVWYCVKR